MRFIFMNLFIELIRNSINTLAFRLIVDLIAMCLNLKNTHRKEVRYICSDEKFLLKSTYFYIIFNESSIKNNIEVGRF